MNEDRQEGRESRSALERVVQASGDEELVARLVSLSGADLTTVLLEVLRGQAGKLSPRDVLERYKSSRFCAPSTQRWDDLVAAEKLLFDSLPDDFLVMDLAPLVPLGTHSVIGTVHQNKVVSAIRGLEVAADPTNGLALEAALRRQELLAEDPRSAGQVKLAASQRVVRSQLFEGAASFAHFRLLGLVTAGRDSGDLQFERVTLGEHVGIFIASMRRAGAERIEVRISDFDGRHTQIIESAISQHRGSDVEVELDRAREDGRGYYKGLCFGGVATWGGQTVEVAEGGLVDWTGHLLSNKKERLFITGIGVEKVALSGRSKRRE